MNILEVITNRLTQKPIFLIGLLTLTNLLVKGIFLGENSLGGDEPFSVYHAQMDVLDITRILTKGNNPPLYEIILHGWIKLFGISEWSVRVPSLLFSCVTLIFIYLIASKWMNQNIAFFAACLFIFSNYHISFAHEARTYALLGMLTAMSVYYYMLIFLASTDKIESFSSAISWKLLIFILVNTTLIYAHYFGFFVLMAECIFFLFYSPARRVGVCKALIVVVSMMLLYSPIISILWGRFTKSATMGTWIKPPDGLESLYNMIWAFCNAPIVAVAALLMVVMLIAAKLTGYSRSTLSPGEKFITFAFAFIFLFMFSISFKVPMFIDRYLMPAAILFCLFLPMAIFRIFNQSTPGRYVSSILLACSFSQVNRM